MKKCLSFLILTKIKKLIEYQILETNYIVQKLHRTSIKQLMIYQVIYKKKHIQYDME